LTDHAVLGRGPVAQEAALEQVILPVRVSAHDDGVATATFRTEDVDAQDRAVADGHLDVVLEADARRRGRDLDRG
jgi:hypothetical protein